MSMAMNYYNTRLDGPPGSLIAMNLIVTPETCGGSRTTTRTQDYAFRLDRALSPREVLTTVPGTHPELECGLDDHQYIVPGAGGLGELLNNAWI